MHILIISTNNGLNKVFVCEFVHEYYYGGAISQHWLSICTLLYLQNP